MLNSVIPFPSQTRMAGPPPRAVTTIVSPAWRVASVALCAHGPGSLMVIVWLAKGACKTVRLVPGMIEPLRKNAAQ